jgi:hypothetical protein
MMLVFEMALMKAPELGPRLGLMILMAALSANVLEKVSVLSMEQ